MKICYVEKTFNAEHLGIINKAEEICDDYQRQGFKLTLRQLYYQFVARALIANTMQSYKRLGGIVADARLAGLLDWDAIEDRTRNLEAPTFWSSPRDIIDACAAQFKYDRWDTQGTRIEVWIEKEALVGVIEPVCRRWRVPYFACRGYTSASEAWAAGRRFLDYQEREQHVVVLHLGDHDPSGMDMTRDNRARLAMFAEADVEVLWLALNKDQIDRYNPPPNPAKLTDSRVGGYLRQFGSQSWELDALEPRVIDQLIDAAISRHVDPVAWDAAKAREDRARRQLREVAENWDEDQD